MATPSFVKGVSVENLLAGRRFLVQWDLNLPSEGVSTYKVYRSTAERGEYTLLASVAAPYNQYIDKVPFTYGVTFFYKVIAQNASGQFNALEDASPVCDLTFDNFEEEPFRATTVQFSSFIYGETPAGTINSANTVFLTASLYRVGSTQVFLNGSRKRLSIDYSENADQKTITFTAAPTTGSNLIVDYLKV